MNKNQKHLNILTIFLFVFFVAVLIRSAWIMEDAYITLRTVDNFINGYGLTWNISERVQVYTHPMWMFLISGLYFFTHEGFYTTIFLSITLSVITFLLVGWATQNQGMGTYIGLSILIFSKAFIDYSTSGLENPLTHLLLASLILVLFSENGKPSNKQVFLISLLASLLAFNRLDTILFVIPLLGYFIWLRRDWVVLRQIFLGFTPLIMWEAFSLHYYGFLFPNTAYAKIVTGVPQGELIKQGYFYFLNSIHWDPITLIVIGITIILIINQGSAEERMLVFGILLYLLYVLWIGGDYMSGRFFSASLLIAVILLSKKIVFLPVLENSIILAFVIILGFVSPTPTLTSIDDQSLSTGRMDPSKKITDERSLYFQSAGLLYDRINQMYPFHHWVMKGQKMKEASKKAYELENVGFTGYFAGPDIFIIDRLGLTDPLLARLHPIENYDWKPGHFERAIPEGYFCSVKNNDNCISDPYLAAYYEKLRLITRGPLWGLERYKTIWEFNIGKYDSLLEKYYSGQDE